jgi:predicted Co/Zn/Cd cation transporter (cation efflux family)
VVRPPDRAYPYGYDGQEALYVLLRSLVLIGILSVAVITAGTTIVNHLGGQAVEAVQLRPVAGYAGLMVVLCLALAWRHEHDWERSGRCSELLRTEAHAARVDGLISAVAGAALLGAPLLERTPLRPLVPVADSVLVLLLALVVLPEPLQQFWRALRQSAGAACDPGLIARTRDAVQELLSGMSTWLLDLTVMKVGRTTFVVAYLNPAMPVDGPWIDRLRERIDARCAELLGPVRTEVILTGQAPFAA